jgi:hypothetical protein
MYDKCTINVLKNIDIVFFELINNSYKILIIFLLTF